MTDYSQLLLKHGFIKENKKDYYYYDLESKGYQPVKGYEIDVKDIDQEEIEVTPGTYGQTEFPSPTKRYKLSWEVYDLSLEEPYFWILDNLKDNMPEIDKVEDSFAAAENSAFFGVTQQRLGAQQDKVSQFLATIGKMIKELFQMVRELRIIDERIGYYRNVAGYYDAELKINVLGQLSKPLDQREKGAEVVLKGMFVDLVQGGGKSAASVYGMARELEFITLPDLFFDAPPFKDNGEIERHVQSLEKDFNRNVIRVLLRHLVQYREWRDRTHKEHEDRRRFMLSYLLQHYKIIEMYITWIKPYLKHVQKLSFKDKNMTSADLVSAFEGSMLDVELLAKKKIGDDVYACVLATFHYRTRPELKVVQEGYQRGPVHIGRFEVQLRAYVWSKEQIEHYKELKKEEFLHLMGDVSASVQEAMKSLGKELEKYLEEAQTVEKGETKEAAQASSLKKSFMERFFGDFYTPQKKSAKKESSKVLWAEEKKKKKIKETAAFVARSICWSTYNNFKKSHRMVTW